MDALNAPPYGSPSAHSSSHWPLHLKIILGVVAVIVVAGIAIAAVYFTRHVDPATVKKDSDENDSSQSKAAVTNPAPLLGVKSMVGGGSLSYSSAAFDMSTKTMTITDYNSLTDGKPNIVSTSFVAKPEITNTFTVSHEGKTGLLLITNDGAIAFQGKFLHYGGGAEPFTLEKASGDFIYFDFGPSQTAAVGVATVQQGSSVSPDDETQHAATSVTGDATAVLGRIVKNGISISEYETGTGSDGAVTSTVALDMQPGVSAAAAAAPYMVSTVGDVVTNVCTTANGFLLLNEGDADEGSTSLYVRPTDCEPDLSKLVGSYTSMMEGESFTATGHQMVHEPRTIQIRKSGTTSYQIMLADTWLTISPFHDTVTTGEPMSAAGTTGLFVASSGVRGDVNRSSAFFVAMPDGKKGYTNVP